MYVTIVYFSNSLSIYLSILVYRSKSLTFNLLINSSIRPSNQLSLLHHTSNLFIYLSIYSFILSSTLFFILSLILLSFSHSFIYSCILPFILSSFHRCILSFHLLIFSSFPLIFYNFLFSFWY